MNEILILEVMLFMVSSLFSLFMFYSFICKEFCASDLYKICSISDYMSFSRSLKWWRSLTAADCFVECLQSVLVDFVSIIFKVFLLFMHLKELVRKKNVNFYFLNDSELNSFGISTKGFWREVLKTQFSELPWCHLGRTGSIWSLWLRS